MTTPTLTTLHFQTHVSDSGVITFPLPDSFRGENVTMKVDAPSDRIPKRSFEELCGVWGNEEDRETGTKGTFFFANIALPLRSLRLNPITARGAKMVQRTQRVYF